VARALTDACNPRRDATSTSEFATGITRLARVCPATTDIIIVSRSRVRQDHNPLARQVTPRGFLVLSAVNCHLSGLPYAADAGVARSAVAQPAGRGPVYGPVEGWYLPCDPARWGGFLLDKDRIGTGVVSSSCSAGPCARRDFGSGNGGSSPPGPIGLTDPAAAMGQSVPRSVHRSASRGSPAAPQYAHLNAAVLG